MKSVEALLWCDGRLFSAGLHSDIVEHDLHTGGVKVSLSVGQAWGVLIIRFEFFWRYRNVQELCTAVKFVPECYGF